jgi:acyl-coenzyme A thioesterase PaaI-like protein
VCTAVKGLHAIAQYVHAQRVTGMHHFRLYAAQGQLSAGSSAGAADSAASVIVRKAWQARAVWFRTRLYAEAMPCQTVSAHEYSGCAGCEMACLAC